MELAAGKIAVVTGGGSGIGLALAERFARNGLHVVLADVDEAALATAAERVTAAGVEVLTVPTDVSDEAAVNALAAATVERFGTAHVVCNNAGVVSPADAWFGPIASWNWVMGVNLWGVIYGIRAFLPILAAQGDGHIVNTSSMAGLMPGLSPSYDVTKHAVVALSEDLYVTTRQMGLNVGVSVLCPGWVQTGIAQADRNWPEELGEAPPLAIGADVIFKHVSRAVAEGTPPAVVADVVADAIAEERFWVLPHPEFVDIAVRRWHDIAEGVNPRQLGDTPGMPPVDQMVAEIAAQFESPS